MSTNETLTRPQALNPYLPLWEHVPDGEPHVFGDRLYVYGSHDRSHGTTFCMEDYVCWSAPLDNLGDWRNEGIIFHKTDDPDNHDPVGYLYAPDVARGPDGRYYLYYFYTGSRKRKASIRVAVCDEPAGHYRFYGSIALTDRHYLPFDPAVLVDDDGRVWLYYGSAFQGPKDILRVRGGAVIELARDMLTPVGRPKTTVPGPAHQKGTGFEGHPFFEASSIRKIGEAYYFVYSSMLSHELCYAVADHPDGPFRYGGTIVSNGDVGLNGNRHPSAPTGNNHGGLVQVQGQWYVFYHRQTQGTAFARQGCAEKIAILPDGSIPQVEITSCGLNAGPLQAKGSYSAACACNLISNAKKKPCFEEELEAGQSVPFVQGLGNGDTLGFKYFAFTGAGTLKIVWRRSLSGVGLIKAMNPAYLSVSGRLEIRTESDGPVFAEVPVEGGTGDWETGSIPLTLQGTHPLFLTWRGNNGVDLKEISFA